MRNLDVHLISSTPPLRSHTTAHVRFTPESGQRADMAACPLCAKSGHCALRENTLSKYTRRIERLEIPTEGFAPFPSVRPNAIAKHSLQMDRRNIAFPAEPGRPGTP